MCGLSGNFLAILGEGPELEAGQADDWVSAPEHWLTGIRAGRLLGAILGCASLFLVWVIAGRLYGQLTALFAAALLAAHPLASFWSRFSLRETTAGLLWMLGLLLVVRSSEKRARLSFFLAGFVLVLGSIQGIGAALLWCAVLLAMKSSPLDLARISLFLILLGLAVFALDGPILLAISFCIVAISGLFLHYSGRKIRRPSGAPIIANSHWAMRGAILGVFAICLFLGARPEAGSDGFDALYTAASPRLFDFGSIPIMIVASIGLGWALIRAERRDAPWLGYAVLALIAGLFARDHASFSGVASAPILCVFAAAGVMVAARILRSAFKPLARFKRLAPTLFLIVLSLSLAGSIGSLERLSRKPTYGDAVEWLQINAPLGARIVIENGILALPGGRFDVMQVESAGDLPPEFYAEQGVRFVVISPSAVVGTTSDASRVPARAGDYAELILSGRGAATFATSASSIGPTIIVIIIDGVLLVTKARVTRGALALLVQRCVLG